ncbi:MAG: DUF4159 domain-containing protein [Gemmatimonadota bacterium]|nr:DUF4159 domain-containing protein [Gemmatimonadota bacterium]
MTRLVIVFAVILSLGAAALAQGIRLRGRDAQEPERARLDAGNNVPYDGRFTFVRIRFTPTSEGFGGRRQDLKWDHDYPRAERNFTKIITEISTLNAITEASNILTLDDPDLFKFPVAYLCEPGFWDPTDEEAAALRAYLLKGGFLIFDDFADGQWYGFEAALRKVLPQARPVPLDVSHPIFDSFFRIESLDYRHPYWGQQSQFLGIYEDNDPTKRLMAIVNYNNDIGEYWEWSDTGFLPVSLSNEAYKLGVNYIMYAMTH